MRLTLLAFALAAIVAAPVAAQQPAAQPAMVKFEVKGSEITSPLTGKAGDAQKGRAVVVSRTQGNCIACHAIKVLENEPYHGNMAPSLDGIADRMKEGEIRLRLVDSTKVNPETMMPAFYRSEGLNKVMKRFQGQTILTAEQVEDVVAFLKTLK